MTSLVVERPEAVSSDLPPAADGRRRRSQASRDRIVAAMMALVEAGAITPSAEEVAARAQVGLRSVFRHFKDMDSLYAEMSLRLARGYEAALLPFASQGFPAQLLEAMDRRFVIFERLLPFKRAADSHRHESTVIQSHHTAASMLLRVRLQALVPTAVRDDPVAFEALDMLLSIDTWARLRIEQQLSVSRARAVIDGLVRRQLGL